MPEWLAQLLAPVGMGVAVYVGIRVDLAVAKSKADQALKSSDDAHGRIDRLLERQHG